MYYISQKKVKKIIFQNNSDKNIFLKKNIVQRNQSVVINGSGFDPIKFKLSSLPKKDPTVFALISRVIKEKGILEYINAASELKKIYKEKVKFLLVGKLQTGNFFINKNIINTAVQKKTIQYFLPIENIILIIQNQN